MSGAHANKPPSPYPSLARGSYNSSIGTINYALPLSFREIPRARRVSFIPPPTERQQQKKHTSLQRHHTRSPKNSYASGALHAHSCVPPFTLIYAIPRARAFHPPPIYVYTHQRPERERKKPRFRLRRIGQKDFVLPFERPKHRRKREKAGGMNGPLDQVRAPSKIKINVVARLCSLSHSLARTRRRQRRALCPRPSPRWLLRARSLSHSHVLTHTHVYRRREKRERERAR